MVVHDKPFDKRDYNRLLEHIRLRASQRKSGNAPSMLFEVFVDETKVIERTDDPKKLDLLDDVVDERTAVIKFKLFDSARSNRNDQHIFRMGGHSLNGYEMGKTEQEIRREERERIRIENLERENARLTQNLRTMTTERNKAKEELETLKNKPKLELLAGNGKALVIEGLTGIAERLLARNPKLLNGLGSLLGGGDPNLENNPSGDLPDVELNDLSTPNPDRQWLDYRDRMVEEMDEEQERKFVHILSAMQANKELINDFYKLCAPTT